MNAKAAVNKVIDARSGVGTTHSARFAAAFGWWIFPKRPKPFARAFIAKSRASAGVRCAE